MKVRVVIGSNYGDEGKGLVSGCLAKKGKQENGRILTVFYNGTSQRAHTFEGKIFRSIAGGVLYGSDTFYHENFVVDPISLYLEYAFTGWKPIIDGNCRVILPCDVISNRRKETARGKDRHGSCGFGLFEAVKRCANPESDIRIRDLGLMNAMELYRKLNDIQKKCGSFDDGLYNMDQFMKAVAFINSEVRINSMDEIISDYDLVIFEGGQGLMLDQTNRGDYPYLTPSCPGNLLIAKDIQKLTDEPELYYVTRSYMTRHGPGPMEAECSMEEINPDIVDKTNLQNEFQGALRFGKVDIQSLQKRIEKDASVYGRKKVNLVVTQTNYTNGKMFTTEGLQEIVKPDFIDALWVSDQKDQMEPKEGDVCAN